MNILYQSSYAYLLPTTISILSLFENNKQVDEINIYIINDGFSKEWEQKLIKKFEPYKRNIKFLELSLVNARLESYGIKKWNDSYTTFLKLFVSDYMPNIDKILYIDSDTIINGSIEPLYNLEMNDNLFAMVYDISVGVGYESRRNYYNAGIILLNLKTYRERDIENKIIRELQDENFVKQLKTADQDVIDALFYDDIIRIPCEYNYTTAYFLFGDISWVKRFKMDLNNFYSSKELNMARQKPVITHYLDHYMGRPWDKFNNNPSKKMYQQWEQKVRELGLENPIRKRSLFDKILKNIVLLIEKILPMDLNRHLINFIFVMYNKIHR